jgi:hypothetical protein
MSVQDLYPAGAFDADGGDNNHAQYGHDNVFSGPGDVDRSRGDSTNARSRAWNALADEAETSINHGRAFPQAGSGGSVGNDGVINHAYGDS